VAVGVNTAAADSVADAVATNLCADLRGFSGRIRADKARPRWRLKWTAAFARSIRSATGLVID
jgi:hypothetical protein